MPRRHRTGFDEYYSDIYGTRWPTIKSALQAEPRYYSLREGLQKAYFLDEASVFVARLLDVQPGDTVLDLCAAPGGKTLVLALAAGPTGTVVANDRSAGRRERLRRVLREHLPAEIAESVTITGHDATRWCLHEQKAYDRVLLDVPCSSERHVLQSETHLQRWGPSRPRRLAAQAYAMLASALETVKPGGSILYSTCALSPAENDGVIQRLSEKRDGRFEIQPITGPFGTPTSLGWQVYPDTDEGRGPMYACKLLRSEDSAPLG